MQQVNTSFVCFQVVERCIMVSSDERQEEFRCAKGLEGNHPFVWIPVVLK